ncbi:hypothetical protein CFIMG_007474RA00001 [Ceratocystis fimbriata CBS 114723]|uniref:Uncharacterized protein n=1 Tax=Ceratocystis fimbriata CBS 114723 TaxID=1035309 RepID=A0A2C5XED2_9PEZI|nr:hypothetical protein CFIMG_007474RA00001 [Ceratocystis fimbriata CBS 114723]
MNRALSRKRGLLSVHTTDAWLRCLSSRGSVSGCSHATLNSRAIIYRLRVYKRTVVTRFHVHDSRSGLYIGSAI